MRVKSGHEEENIVHTSDWPDWMKSDHKSSSADVGLAAAVKRTKLTHIV